MQDQGKRLLLAVALALGVMLVWNMVFHKDEPPLPPTGSGSQVAPKPATPQVGVASGGSPTPAAAAGSGGSSVPAVAPAVQPVEELPRPPEKPLDLAFDNVVATFSSYCGGLKSWRLTDKRYANDPTKGLLLPDRSLMTMTNPEGKPVPGRPWTCTTTRRSSCRRCRSASPRSAS